mgnify:CR=1 FL=1
MDVKVSPHALHATTVEPASRPSREQAEEAVRIAAGICVYTNEHISVEVLTRD